MKPAFQDPLLQEILADESLKTVRQTSLECMKAAGRKRRGQRQLIRKTAGVTAIMLLALALVLERAYWQPIHQQVSTQPSASSALSATPGLSDVELINDSELLAFFPGRPVALIGPPGRQQLLFLDEPGKNQKL